MKKSCSKKFFTILTLLKQTLTQVFSSEYCESFKNTYFEQHPLTAAEYWGAAASVLNKFRLLTVYEQ